MDWNNYLLDEKCPSPPYAHLGMLNGEVWGYWDLSQIPQGTKILSLPTPLKKTRLSYSNWDALTGNTKIEAIRIDCVDSERIEILSSLPNLRYLEIRNNKQPVLPDLSLLTNLKVLVLADIQKNNNLDFVVGLKHLKTLYIYNMKHLYDLSPLSELQNLKELLISKGGITDVGKPVKSMEPIGNLLNLEYLHFSVTVENRNYDISPLFNLKRLRHLFILPRFLKNGSEEKLKEMLPLLKWRVANKQHTD